MKSSKIHLEDRHRKILEDIFHKYLPNVEVWAYGSRVNGESHDGSDLDLVLRGPNLQKVNFSQFLNMKDALTESNIPFLVEARDWAELPKSFHKEIKKNYYVLIESSSKNEVVFADSSRTKSQKYNSLSSVSKKHDTSAKSVSTTSFLHSTSLLRKQESFTDWMPAYAGMTGEIPAKSVMPAKYKTQQDISMMKIKNNRNVFSLKSFIYIFCIVFTFPLYARVYINVGQAKVKKSLLAVSPLVYTDSPIVQEHLGYGKAISVQIKKNLNSSGYFNLIPSGAFVEDPKTRAVIPHPKHPKGFRWENWKVIGAEFLILARYSIENNQINLRIYMYDILLRKTIFKKEYDSPISKRVSVAHVVCNDIIKYLTKKPGIFLTKVAAVRNFKNNKKEIFVMNWDGSDKKQISFHRSISMTPVWHSTGKKLAYTAFVYRRSLKGRRANIFLYDFGRKKRRIITGNYGTNLGADFFPSGRDMLITIPSKWGGLDIFKLSLRSKKAFPVRMGPRGAINVEPSVHPNGKKILFSSDRSGKIMIYEMNKYGENIRQLTFTGQYNSSPDWSPDGKQIVFSGYSRGRFDLFIMNAEGPSNIRRLTTAKARNGRWSNNESPSFSPDGRQIVFTSDRTGASQLYTIHTDGSNLKRITFDRYNYKSPKWSPLIKSFFQH